MKGFIIRIGKERYWLFDRYLLFNDTGLPAKATRFATMKAAQQRAALIRAHLVTVDRKQDAKLVAVLPADDHT